MQELLTGKKRLPGFSGKWESKLLGELFTFSGGYTASRDQLSTEGHCYLHYGDIHKSTKTFIDTRVEIQDIPKLDVPLRKVSASALLEDGDVVFVDASEDDEGTSKHVVIINEGKISFISGLHTIVAKSKSDDLARDYRRYCFQTRAIRDQFLFYAVDWQVYECPACGEETLIPEGESRTGYRCTLCGNEDSDAIEVACDCCGAKYPQEEMEQWRLGENESELRCYYCSGKYAFDRDRG